MMLLACCCEGCGDQTAPRFENTTQVANWADPATPALIDPYSRTRYTAADGGCTLTECPGSAGIKACWNQGFDYSSATFNSIPGITPGGDVEVDFNGYADAAETVTITNPCYGWKGVIAMPVWTGRLGFMDCCDTEGTTQTKYTTITSETTATFHAKLTAPACGGGATQIWEDNYEVTLFQTASVDAHGNVTRSGSVSIFYESLYNGTPVAETGIDSCVLSDGIGIRFQGNSSDLGAISDGIIPRGDLNLDAACGIIQFGTDSGNVLDGPGVTGSAATLNAAEYYAPVANRTAGDPCDASPVAEITITSGSPAVFTLSNTELSVSWSAAGTIELELCCGGSPSGLIATQESSMTFEKTVTLSGARNFSQVKTDGETLLDTWSLKDDAVYPWRTDASVWLVPLVTRDAAAIEPTIDWTVDEACAFLSTSDYTGDIKGSPNPAGYDRHFNFNHIVWQATQNGDGSVCTACEASYGELSASPLPATATQWTDKFMGANSHGPGAWMTTIRTGQYSTVDDAVISGIVMQKWAETIMAWPALNYARPCARDRYLFDETAIACIIDFTAPDLEIEAAPVSGDVEFEVGDVIAINTGVYQIATKTDAQNYTVGSKLYDLLIPCDGASKLRFPSARAIAGALTVANAVQTSPGVVTITLSEKHWLKRGGTSSDTVDFTGVAGLVSGLTATVVDDENFTVPGTLGAWTSGGTVSQTGSQTAWDTTCSRKTYVTREYADRYREFDPGDPGDLNYTVTRTQRDYTSTSLANPYVVVISPNSDDTPTKGVRYGFAATFEADHCFGSEWHMDVVQAVPDPFWQADHVPCGHSGGWAQATEPCGEDANHYQYPPLIEARLTDPSGAPTLPVNVFPEDGGIPAVTGHPNCDATPYDDGTLHSIRAAWEACDDWQERTMHRC
jgi:hypothetical protein